MSTQTILVEGMTCDHCKKAVEDALRGVEGVTSVQVSLAEKRAQVEGVADSTQLLAAIAEEGYQARLP